MKNTKSHNSISFDLFKNVELESIVGILGGKELMSTDTAQGSSEPHAKDIADRTPAQSQWDNVEWLTAEDPDFDNY